MKRSLVIVAAGLMLTLTACQGPQSGSSPEPSGSAAAPSAAPSASAPETPSAKPTIKGPSLPPPAGDSITVTGTVAFMDIEGGCWALKTPAIQYQLVGGDHDVLKDGAKVVVVGVLREGMATTCQIGKPLQVLSARPA